MKSAILVLALGFVLASNSASAELVRTPATGSMEAALLDGLKLIKNGKFDDWVSKYCSKEKICVTPDAISGLKRLNLSMIQRRAPACLRENETAIDINRVLDGGDGAKTVFLNCEVTATPIPFHLVKEGDTWRFSKI